MSGALGATPGSGPGVVYARKTKVQPILNPDVNTGDDNANSQSGTAPDVAQAALDSDESRKVNSSPQEKATAGTTSTDKRTPEKSPKSLGSKQNENGLKVKPQLKKVENDNFTRKIVVNEDEDKPPTLIPLAPEEQPKEIRPRGTRKLLKFKCTVTNCNKSFPNQNTLDAHVSTHSDGSFECTHCSKVFRWKQSWRNHVKSHQKTFEPYKCNTCLKGFTLRSSWYTHTKALSCVAANPSPILTEYISKEKTEPSSVDNPEIPLTPSKSPTVTPNKRKRQSASAAVTQPQTHTGKKHQMEQSGLPIKKRGRPVRIGQSGSLSNEIEGKAISESEEQEGSENGDTPESSGPSSVSKVEISPPSNGISAITPMADTIQCSPEPSSRAQRKRNPPKWTENMVMDYELSSYTKVQTPRTTKTTGSRKSSVESSLADVSPPTDRNQELKDKRMDSPLDEPTTVKNFTNPITSKDENDSKAKVGIKADPVVDIKEMVITKPEEPESSTVPPSPVPAVSKVVPRPIKNEPALKRSLNVAPKSEKIETSDKTNGANNQGGIEKEKVEDSSDIKETLLAKFGEAIRSSKITRKNVTVPVVAVSALAVTPQQSEPTNFEDEMNSLTLSTRGRKRKIIDYKKVEGISNNRQPSKRINIATPNEQELVDGNKDKEAEALLAESDFKLASPIESISEQINVDIDGIQTPNSVINSNADDSLNLSISNEKAEKPSPKRGRPRLVQPEQSPKLVTPTKINLEQSLSEKKSLSQTESLSSTCAELGSEIESLQPSAADNILGATTTVAPATRFCGMPRLLNQSSVVSMVMKESGESSDSEDDSTFANGGSVTPPGGRRLSTEPYIKDEAMRFLANKISNRNMLRIRQELMLLKQSGNYFKLTKTAPLAAGLIHDMFCQTLDP